jgi:hypothetical protein
MPSTSHDDDSTMGELFEARRIASQAKRASNREFSTNLLQQEGIAFTSHNQGAHLIVAGAWNFWPGTGRWEERKGKPGIPPRSGRGVQRLVKILKEQP